MDIQTRLRGKTALITGASSGIGYETALAFARAGVHVAATARRVDRLEQLQVAADGLPGAILPLAADVRDAASMQAAAAAAVERFGRLDILVANAGVGQRGSIAESDWEHLETLLRTNIDGVLHSIRAAVPLMQPGGQIVLVSSIVFNMTLPYAASYAASKAFVSSLARSLRFELAAQGIDVTDMRVGRTITEFNEKRLGKAGRASSGIVGSMSASRVAAALVRAAAFRQRIVYVRLLDWLIVLANRLAPGIIGRIAAGQYTVKGSS